MAVYGGRTHSAVLVPLFTDHAGRLHAVFTKRREDLSRHAGEISFPGGRRDPGESLEETALREAHEEIGLPPSEVDVIGALVPVGTVATDYAIYPFVGLIEPGFAWVMQETEVAEVLELALDDLVAGHSLKRMVRRGIAFRTDVYEVDGHMVWGATSRILTDLLNRLEVGPRRPWRLERE
ncbi:CoA pyrophosphatase [Solirubrobacter sp. CPCC 204708]|uniref:CoA pyrophosphatase n=1 Tax=Solirubrobacter deserti TaxID=2282478 RepID=A0ABT4RIJ5_9ACTN|nr:CoA pyrophosphatase [Solirubrobacter deserti]MBE2320316.1 CoA pyrophosphatase [Solirubrobacter deserti]MDA0138298.1 CoA pyrophosphatase [Solirubrobacter deserti]